MPSPCTKAPKATPPPRNSLTTSKTQQRVKSRQVRGKTRHRQPTAIARRASRRPTGRQTNRNTLTNYRQRQTKTSQRRTQGEVVETAVPKGTLARYASPWFTERTYIHDPFRMSRRGYYFICLISSISTTVTKTRTQKQCVSGLSICLTLPPVGRYVLLHHGLAGRYKRLYCGAPGASFPCRLCSNQLFQHFTSVC